MKKISWFYGFFLPFTSVLSLSGWVNIPVLLSVVVLIVFALRGVKFGGADALIASLWLVPPLLSAICNIKYIGEEKYLTHLFSYLFVFIFFYLSPLQLLRFHSQELMEGVLAGLFAAIFFSLCEFVVVLFFGADSMSWVPRSAVLEYEPTFSGMIRVRSFVEESGHFALYLGIIGPVCMAFYLSSKSINRQLLVISVILWFFVLLLTFSTSGILALLFSFAIASFFKKRKLYEGLPYLLKYSVLSVLIYFGILNFFQIDLTELITQKIDGLNGRQIPLAESFNLFLQSSLIEMVFGFGPGYYSYLNVEPVISLIGLVLFENGIFGLACYFLLYLFVFILILKRYSLERFYLIIALIFSFVIYCGISNYWYPWLWFLFAIARYPDIFFNIKKDS